MRQANEPRGTAAGCASTSRYKAHVRTPADAATKNAHSSQEFFISSHFLIDRVMVDFPVPPSPFIQ